MRSVAFIITILFPFYLSAQMNDSCWTGKSWVTYGNSITAIGNGNQEAPFSITNKSSWQEIVSFYLGFEKHYGRGVGGQSFIWNQNTWWADQDGCYVDRPNGKKIQPENTTTHIGAFCSWDRITTMIPRKCDLILIMGGTNDWGRGPKTLGDLSFDSHSKIDSLWAQSEYYVGDFDISTFKGAVASTIMKIQAWCPDAILVIATPLSGRGDTPKENMTSQSVRADKTTEDYAQAIKEVAYSMSIPVIDVFGTTGINQFNRNRFISDTVHPYSIDNKNSGCKALARSIISGLRQILPNI